MEWVEFKHKCPAAHLVIGEYDPHEPFFKISHFSIVARLVVALLPRGQWAMQKVHGSRWLGIYVAYEAHTDALALAKIVGASPGSHAPLPDRWGSVYSYWLNRSLCSEMVAETAALSKAPKPREP
jgi:hypothetical protein